MIVGQIEPFQTDCLDEQDALSVMTAANVKKPQNQAFIRSQTVRVPGKLCA